MKQLVRLRHVGDSDFDVLFEWINNRDLVAFNAPFREISLPEHLAWFERIRAQEDIAFFMIENVETGLTIGSCQLLNIHPIHRSAELQIRIGAMNFQNQGAGSEAVRQLTDYGFSVLNLHRISLHVFENNLRAIRVYEKNGFAREGLFRQAARIEGHWLDVVYMAKVRGLDD
jgi:UDP-4-amino-4,6-dideoxy-N-acetyl-beta-L-altrosamine N-acetyltransferase